uniref:BRCT domain-containing protein n=1 Tax=Ciona savignyi TaxID=51511 RepID=H2Z8T8_CIOSA
MEGVTIDDVTKGDVTMATKDPESSQDVQVVWDDPIGREELQRLRQQNKVDPETTKDESSVEESSPVDEDENRISQIIREGKVPSFLISSVTPEQKAEYASIIQELGGKYLERDYFDPSCTHLIVKNPARNEKFLASLSSGKWILHTSYMEACRSARAFVKEEDYEFGNPSFEWTARNETEALLVASAYRWRQGLNRGSTGAFHGWKVILHVSDRHLPGFARLLECGSGSVVAKSLPYTDPIGGVTHAIIDPNKAKQINSSEIERLVRAGVHCCIPECIAEFLMKSPQPAPETLYLPIVKSMIAEFGEVPGSETPSKRRRFN